MHILFLSHYFPPEVNAPATRTFEHCREWVAAGNQVTVITCAPNHPRGVVYPGYRNRLWQRESIAGISVVRVWTFLSANEGFLLRTLNYVSFMLSAALASLFVRSVDVVLTTSPQFFNGLAGAPVRLFKRVPWVLEIRDLWPESILAVGAIRNRTVIRVLEWLERYAYRSADAIVPVTDAFSRHIAAHGGDAGKITVIKNGANLEQYQPLARAQSPVSRELGLDSKFVAAYFGTHGMAHKLETVFDAAARLRHRADVVFLLAGDGAERARLLALRAERGLDNVLMLDQQPKERMRDLWAAVDVSLVLLRRSDTFKTVIPSKIFESLAMEKPVILGVEGESKELVEASGGGITIPPEDDAALARTVEALADDRGRLSALGKAGRAFVITNFDRRALAARYLRLLDDLVGRGASRARTGAGN